MTDQEQKTGASAAGGSSVVMVEQSTASRHKAYRPIDLQDETQPELHHKRSRAPAVPSVAEELKDSETENIDIKEQKEYDHEFSSEKHTYTVAKKLSSTTKRRASSPETIALAPLEVEIKRADIITPPTQPIPVPIGPEASDISDISEEKKEAGIKEDEDSITVEITELRTADPTQKASEWDTGNRSQKYVPENQETEDTIPLQRKLVNEIINKIDNVTENKKDVPVVRDTEDTVPPQRKSGSRALNENITSTEQLKKKEISWKDSKYLDKVQLQPLQVLKARSATWMLERKASVGPCYKKTMPFGEPSGITISLPKKSMKNIDENINPIKSGISLTVSKKCLDSNSKPPIDFELKNTTERIDLARKGNKIEIKIEEDNCANFFGNLKGKLDNLRGKIKHVLQMDH